MTRVGILAIQGDMERHAAACARLGAEACPVLFDKDLDHVDALIIPGGESSTISKGLERLALMEPLRARIRAGLPVLGTCAGAIMLSRLVENKPVPVLNLLDVTAVRNAYGTQVDSFAREVDAGSSEEFTGMRCVFIRAPQLKSPGAGVRVLATVAEQLVLVQQDNILAATFHPELTDDTRVHARLIAMADNDQGHALDERAEAQEA